MAFWNFLIAFSSIWSMLLIFLNSADGFLDFFLFGFLMTLVGMRFMAECGVAYP